MQSRLHMQNKTHMVEFPDTCWGKMQIKAFRKSHPEFKGCKIREVIQAYPEKIEMGTIYKLT